MASWESVPVRSWRDPILRYRKSDGGWVVQAEVELHAVYSEVDEFRKEFDAAVAQLSRASVHIDYDGHFLVHGERAATPSEVERITKHIEKKKRDAARAKERRAEADRRALASLRRKYPDQFVPEGTP